VNARVLREVIMPTVQGMAADGIPFTGFLYAGLMIDPQGKVRTLEFNCRMGDPETQPIMARLKSDLAEIFELAIDGRLDSAEVAWDRRPALGVVLAAHGYPDDPRRGDVIDGLAPDGNGDRDDLLVFHAGTTEADGRVLTSGGRVLCVTALGDSVKIAQAAAYERVGAISFDGMQYRHDIGHRALARKR
jgi:phosphoribosylamine--glycine ligase